MKLISRTSLLLVIVSFLSFTALYDTEKDKNSFLISLANNHCSNAKDILNTTSFSVNSYCKENSFEALLNAFPTVVHESYHKKTHSINLDPSVRKYFINNELTFEVPVFDVFRSEEMDQIVDNKYKDQIFRYGEYINSTDFDMDSQENGIFGILEEYTAYYQDILAYQEMYAYLEQNIPYSETELWVSYLVQNGNVLSTSAEFNLFISWYMQYAKVYHPNVYNKIVKSEELKELYQYVNNGFSDASDKFHENRETILNNIEPFIDQHELFIRVKNDKYFYELPDNEVKKMEAYLNEPSHQILTFLCNK